jgi:putative hydrolase of the HAD superfamily
VFNLSKDETLFAYERARKQVHIELCETAASHNRLLYFQKMLEILNINPMKHSLKLYNIYWDNFLDIIKPFEEIYLLLDKYKDRICLITDLTAHIQYRKIKKIGLEKYCDKLVTSEETGHEKPHPYIFISALNKLGLRADEVCMIGDNFKKDILGSAALGIESIWFNHEDKQESHNDKLITEVKSFNEILELL